MRIPSNKKSNWSFGIGKRELLGLFSAFVLGGFAEPWWLFVIISIIAGGLTAARKPKVLIWIAMTAGIAWVVAALTQDLVSAGRISKRLAGIFALPFPALLYLGLFFIAAILSLLGAVGARLFVRGTYRPYLGEKP